MSVTNERFNGAGHSPLVWQRTESAWRAQVGAGLIEVMVAILILGVGLLGIAAMQATALRNSQSSLERSQAVIQTYAVLDAMRANSAVAKIGGYNLSAPTCSPPDAGDRAATDLHDWIQSLHDTLGEGACGQIECGSVECNIIVQWNDSRAKDGEQSGSETQQLETRTRL